MTHTSPSSDKLKLYPKEERADLSKRLVLSPFFMSNNLKRIENMLYLNITDYEYFLDCFGMEVHGNGNKSRKNKILLNHFKSRDLLHWCRVHNDYELLNICSMADLKKVVLEKIRKEGKNDDSLNNKVTLIGKTYYSAQYRTDEYNGRCIGDGDKSSIRYVNIERNRIFKKKAGKFFTAILTETGLGQALSKSVIIWLTEEFVREWAVYNRGFEPDVELHVDNNFQKIYDSYYCKGFNGCSCMVGKLRHEFYEESVEAKAAYITDAEGFVLCRAILFTNVTDENGKKWRLLERQYSKESSETLKHLLIDLLIKRGEIDGYKVVGASCSDSRNFVAVDGSSLSDKKFSIKVDLNMGDILSYQDSFKYYFMEESVAYNYEKDGYEYNLDITDYNLYGDTDEDDEAEWDNFHEYSCDSVTTCYAGEIEYQVDSERIEEDFVYIDSLDEYHHKDDVIELYGTDEKVLRKDAYYSDEAEAWFMSEEDAGYYIKDNWHYSDIDQKYFRNENEVRTINVWNGIIRAYERRTIHKDTLDSWINGKRAYEIGAGKYYDIIDPGTHLPFGYTLMKSENEQETRLQTVKEAV